MAMEFGTVEYFKNKILIENEHRYQRVLVTAYTRTVLEQDISDSLKIEQLNNLMAAWDELGGT
ncbi:hypothetical protein [Paenibacillus sp. XY044]|uniref:hypothetical protein n=1 Tax=Paenibacillus sp. XY044 TaxID=2026089 RepID=UPI000B9928BA|nr:hypothetical protein [Paenibacillus sp. XY044]OZB89970.1 hypothetical protein CJP46_35985 [Paenibacillus sp. XY044]